MNTLIALYSSTISLLILAASLSPPKFVVPNLPDLTVKTRRTSGGWLSQVSALYVKGARQRTETVNEKPARANAMKGGSSTSMNGTNSMPLPKSRIGPSG